MKVLVIGAGGREHALAWRLSQCESVDEVFASPGNPGIAQVAQCFPPSGYLALAQRLGVDLTVVGPEAPLVAGVVNSFRNAGLRIVGPTQEAAQLEGSKIFAKRFFDRAGIPTARSIQVASVVEGLSALRKFPLPVVIKADGLAAGKGVVIATTDEEAKEAVQRLGPLLVIEEFLDGEEVSFIALSDGRRVFPFAPSQDHKRICDGDKGPNTGGMGAYCDTRILNDAQTSRIMDRIMLPAVNRMEAERTPFTGFLYAGLMMTSSGPKVLEFNVRLGDPETQAILHGCEGDFADFLIDPAPGKLHWRNASVCVVLAAEGYPGAPVVGDNIRGLEAVRHPQVFHAGTLDQNGSILTSGGRVLGVTTTAPTLPQAISSAYSAVAQIDFRGMQYRRDIGHKGLHRW